MKRSSEYYVASCPNPICTKLVGEWKPCNSRKGGMEFKCECGCAWNMNVSYAVPKREMAHES